MTIVTYDQVKSKIMNLRNQKVILDNNVAKLYGVDTKRVNEAVKRNPEKFPAGYLIYLDVDEWSFLKSQFATSSTKGGKVKLPIAFTEAGLYMLATILKSPKAIETSIAIIDTFTQIRDLANFATRFESANDIQKIGILDNCTNIITDLLDNELIISHQETNVKIKLPFFELSKTTTKIKK